MVAIAMVKLEVTAMLSNCCFCYKKPSGKCFGGYRIDFIDNFGYLFTVCSTILQPSFYFDLII